MTTVQIDLPDTLVQRARSEGLLSDCSVQKLLEDAMRRQAGLRLMQTLEHLHDAGIKPMSDEEINAEIRAARAERRTGQ